MLNKGHHTIRINLVCRCRISVDKVMVDPPILWGRGFVFDRHKLTTLLCNRFLGFLISKAEVPFSHITHLQVREVVENPFLENPFWKQEGNPGYLFFVVLMKVANYREELQIAKIQFSEKNKEEAQKRAEQIETAIRAVTGISHEKETEQGLYWIRLEMCESVLKKPSISHTELLGSVQGNSDLKELAINQLVKQGELRCEQKGRARKYYPKDY